VTSLSKQLVSLLLSVLANKKSSEHRKPSTVSLS